MLILLIVLHALARTDSNNYDMEHVPLAARVIRRNGEDKGAAESAERRWSPLADDISGGQRVPIFQRDVQMCVMEEFDHVAQAAVQVSKRLVLLRIHGWERKHC